MQEFSYAHRNTSSKDRWNIPQLAPELAAARESAFSREIPVAADDTLCFVLAQAAAIKPRRILELGTAVGITSAALALACPHAHITTVEREQKFYDEAVQNFNSLGISPRVCAILGDAGEVISTLSGQFDMIFLDCAKVQYVKYLPRLKELLSFGGVLLADDVLLYGWASGEAEVPKKRKMLAQHIEEYLSAVTADGELVTAVVKVGDGMAVSVKKQL